jgi:hypothetical protein
VSISLIVVAAVAAASFAFGPDARSAATQPREVVLVARGMAFYLEGEATPNPPLHLRRGEVVRLRVRNETPGMVHDFVVNGLKLSVGPLQAGQHGAVVFDTPDLPGQHQYVCRPHAVMMKGQISVQ